MDTVMGFMAISAAVWVAMKILKGYFDGKKWFKDIKPVIPPVLGIFAGMLAGSLIVEGFSLGEYAVLGWLAGGMSANSHDVIKRAMEKRAELDQ